MIGGELGDFLADVVLKSNRLETVDLHYKDTRKILQLLRFISPER